MRCACGRRTLARLGGGAALLDAAQDATAGARVRQGAAEALAGLLEDDKLKLEVRHAPSLLSA